MDVNITQLAIDAAKLLAPFLPYLIAGTKAAAEEAGRLFGAAAWEQAAGLWKQVWGKAKKKESAKEAIEDAAQHPEDEDAQAAFRRQLTKLLEADEKLRNFVAERVTIENMVHIDGNVEASTFLIGQGNQLINAQTYIHANIYKGPPPRNSEDALKVYRAFMTNATASLSMRGIDLRAADPNTQRAIGLANVYIDLDTTVSVPLKDEDYVRLRQESKDPLNLVTDKTRAISALEAVINNRAAVIKGDPGSGKSTFVNYLTYSLSTRTTKNLSGWKKKDADALPIIVILRDFVRAFKKLPEQAEPRHLWDFIEKRLKDQNLSPAARPILDLLEKGNVILFFDGLDEVSTVPQRIFVRDAVHAFVNRYPKNRVVVTCRILSYIEPKQGEPDLRLTGFPEFELAQFDHKKITTFIDAWYRELTALGVTTPETAADLNASLKTAIQRPELRKLAPNPLLLTVMAVVNTHKGRLPDHRAPLYKDTVEILLWQWEQSSKGQDAARLRQLMQDANCTDADIEQVICKLAFEAHAYVNLEDDEETLAGISEISLQKELAAINKNDLNWAAAVIETMKMRAGLLLERENHIFTLPHRSFQEFLAGTYLDSKDDFVQRAMQLADNQLLWRQVILWAVSRRVFIRGSVDGPLALVGELCPAGSPPNEKGWSRAWLAGDILLEIGLNRVERSELGKDLLLRLQDRLALLLQGSHLTSRERAEAADTLARLGDPRFDAGHWHLPKESLLGFVHIPAGDFWMGTREENIKEMIGKFGGKEDYYKNETPQHKLSLPDYYMARYPITTAQFKAFVEESGHKPTDEDSLRGLPTRPAVYVTWYDSLAYCKWLTEKLKAIAPDKKGLTESEETFWRGLESGGLTVTLPSEAEWEKAARGGDARNFPWGEDVNLDKVNGNNVIGRTSAVGVFPQGKSPYDLQDMSGNVWEWTRSLYKDYEYDPQDGRESMEADQTLARVLRGGAYLNGGRYLRCAGRNRNDPFFGNNYVGFRVVVRGVSPISP